MNVSMEGLENVARTFGYEWKAHHLGQLEDATLFGRTLDEDWRYFLEGTGVSEEDLSGATVLDAGCGSGRLTRQIGEHGPAAVVGMDVNEAVDEAYAATKDLPNVHIVQANIFAPPFRGHAFDVVWSNGVIHHTPDAAGAHASLSAMVQPGGILYVWVYAKRFNPFRFVKDALDLLRVTRLPEPALLALSRFFALVSLPLLAAYRAIRRLPGLRPRTAWGERTARPRSRKELELTWFDALSPEHDSRHTEAEVVGWFQGRGFVDVTALEEPKVGVRGMASDDSN
jgi:SAM-dependent methyltransferase